MLLFNEFLVGLKGASIGWLLVCWYEVVYISKASIKPESYDYKQGGKRYFSEFLGDQVLLLDKKEP